ncbi:E3 ubiquitin-protein ligase CHIP-like [Portunus trituberculatus]|uniref:E3 ubiquitin-protein ligase CHIP-like n=1 Tax=Portunus trituberculatus TaxID=210409 RepID=UPI001E1CE554|nr:E3 ubiquitin-protein ligase CHIP-like [Portunus trituberculatus]
MSRIMTDLELKNRGNKLFSVRKFDEAIKCYTDAIAKKPSVAVYYTNRALCNLKLKRWELVCQDCRTALEIDPTLVKAQFFLGQALLEMDNFDESIKHLTRAHDLAKEQKVNYGDDVACMIRVARKRRFNVAEEKRISQEIELQTYLNRLILEDRDRQIDEVRRKYENDEDRSQEEVMRIEQETDNYITEVNTMFARLDERRRKREVPDYLCGKISFEILRQPVVTPSGITYDRKDIEEHLQRVGHFDPITRTDLTVDQLMPNLAMKEVVDAFLSENEWALDY